MNIKLLGLAIFNSIIFQLNLFSQITPHQMVAKMGRGINMGNVMSASTEGNWAPAFTKSYFEDVAQAGFKTVRLPIDFLEPEQVEILLSILKLLILQIYIQGMLLTIP